MPQSENVLFPAPKSAHQEKVFPDPNFHYEPARLDYSMLTSMKSKSHRKDQLLAKAAVRMANLKVTQAWRAWLTLTRAVLAEIALLGKAASFWVDPVRAAGCAMLRRWNEVAQEMIREQDMLLRAAVRFDPATRLLAAAFGTWEEKTETARQQMMLVRKAAIRMKSAELRKASDMFALWRKSARAERIKDSLYEKQKRAEEAAEAALAEQRRQYEEYLEEQRRQAEMLDRQPRPKKLKPKSVQSPLEQGAW